MIRQLLVAVILCAAPVWAADILPTPIPSYDGTGYDFTTSPTTPPAFITIGTFSFTIPAGLHVTGITVSGSYGNNDSPTTALADFFINFTGSGSPVEVAACDNPASDCFSDTNGPTPWKYTFTSSDLTKVAPQLAKGTLDFSFTMDAPPFTAPGLNWAVFAGQTNLDIQIATAAPEPLTVFICFTGLAVIAALRRSRKA
jgi:hypothetical protein